jgi:hypothetical protein
MVAAAMADHLLCVSLTGKRRERCRRRHDTPPPVLPVGHQRDRESDQRQRPIEPRHDEAAFSL